MGRITVEDIDARVKEAQDREARLTDEIAELENTGSAIDVDIEDAAKKGDVDLYLANKKRRADVDEEIYVKRTAMENISADITLEEVLQAWSNYSDQYNKTLRKKLDTYYSLRQKMRDTYRELIDLQGDALETRERLARYVGVKVEPMAVTDFDKDFTMEFIPQNNSELKLAGAPRTITDPDALYYLAGIGPVLHDLQPNGTVKKMDGVLVWHRVKSPLYY